MLLYEAQAKGPYANYKNILDEIYTGISGYGIPQEESELVREGGGDPTYGELTYEAAEVLFEDFTTDTVFYDLGSGVGKVIAQVYLTTPAKKAVGYELADTRVKAAMSLENVLRNLGPVCFGFDHEIKDIMANKDSLANEDQGDQEANKKGKGKKGKIANPKADKKGKVANPKPYNVPNKYIKFFKKNFLEADLSDATVIYTCSTCFSDDLMQKLADKFATLKDGLVIMTLKALPPHENIYLERTLTLPMTWSKATPVYVYVLDRTRKEAKPEVVAEEEVVVPDEAPAEEQDLAGAAELFDEESPVEAAA